MEPRAPAQGRNGRWVKIGEVSVDSATMMVVDPTYRNEIEKSTKSDPPVKDLHIHDFGTGVSFMAGFGDGGYEVWAWIADYGKDDHVDERIGQIVVTLIDDEELADWHGQPTRDFPAEYLAQQMEYSETRYQDTPPPPDPTIDGGSSYG